MVHGGGPQATALSRRLGVEPMVAGRRVTDAAALEVAKLVYAGQLNVDLLAALRAHRVQAVGLSGVDADLITAHRRPRCRWWTTPARPPRWTTATWATWTGWIPGSEHPGGGALRPGRGQPRGRRRREVFNVNADTVAESLAVAMRAQKLIFLTGAPACCATGTIPPPSSPSPIPTISPASWRAGC